MESKNIVAGVLTITVALIVTASVLVPVLNSATETSGTFTNDGFIRMTQITDESEDVTITWDPAEPFVFVINGEDYNMPTNITTGNLGVFPYTIFSSDGWGMRYTYSNNRVDLNLYGTSDNSLLWYATSDEVTVVSITFISGTASFTKGSTVATQSYTDAFIISNDGEYTLKKTSDSSYILGDSQIYSTGRTVATFGETVLNVNVHLEGSIDDGVNVSVIAPAGYTASDIVVTSAAVTGYNDLYAFDKVTFTITEDATQETVSATYGQVIVPYQVTAELSQHLNSAEIGLINVLPVLVIVSIVLMAVGMAAFRRD